MSTSEILSMISLISFILAGISAVLAVLFWIRFHIPSVIGDLSGRTARKSIEKMRVNNEKTGKKDFAPSKTNLNRGKVTALMDEKMQTIHESEETGLLTENEQTELLNESEETGLLVEENETMLLVEENVSRPKGFVLLEEIILIHTEEVI